MLEEFKKNIKNYVEQVYEIANTCPYGNFHIEMDVEKLGELDNFVNTVSNLFDEKIIDDDMAWNMSVSLGVFLGECIIKKHELNWIINDENIPVLEDNDKNQLSPITKIYKIITSEDDNEGTPSGFYNGYLTLKNYHEMTEGEK